MTSQMCRGVCGVWVAVSCMVKVKFFYVHHLKMLIGQYTVKIDQVALLTCQCLSRRKTKERKKRKQSSGHRRQMCVLW